MSTVWLITLEDDDETDMPYRQACIFSSPEKAVKKFRGIITPLVEREIDDIYEYGEKHGVNMLDAYPGKKEELVAKSIEEAVAEMYYEDEGRDIVVRIDEITLDSPHLVDI